MRILIIEDDENKRKQLEGFLTGIVSECSIDICESYNSGLRSVLSNEVPDIVVLDMTMPTYDIGLDEDGGRPQHYAGRAILRQMKRHAVTIPVVVVTQFDIFGEGEERMTREELDAQLRRDHSDVYLGTVYYNAAVDGWKNSLGSIILTVKNGKGDL
jgi:CheY-like chemotaxis protein